MKTLLLVLAIGVIVLAAGCAAPAHADVLVKARSAVSETLREPASAHFQSLRAVNKGRAACGEVNARNGFGGYTGFQSFLYIGGQVLYEGDLYLPPPDELRHKVCRASWQYPKAEFEDRAGVWQTKIGVNAFYLLHCVQRPADASALLADYAGVSAAIDKYRPHPPAAQNDCPNW